MNYALARSMEVQRISPEQLITVQTFERNIGRCFMPHEFQILFHLPELKIHYGLPEVETAQSIHTQRIVSDFYSKSIFPEFLHLSPLDIEKTHHFDEHVATKVLDFTYSGGKKKRLREELNGEHWSDQ